MVNYNIYQLRQYAKKFLMDTYNLELTIPLQLNSRLQRTCGWFRHTRYKDGRDIPNCIELNKYFVENNEPNVVLDVLRHECIHYAMFMLKRPFKDGSKGFEAELKRLCVVSQKDIDKYVIQSKPKKMIVYKCIMPNCGQEYHRTRKLQGDGAFHHCKCGGRIKNMGTKMVETA